MAKDENSKLSQRINGLKLEFSKIVWPTGETVYKKSLATLVVSIILGILIAVIDMLVQYGVDFLVNL